MKTARLATLIRILGSSENMPLTAMERRRLRKPRRLKVKMSVLPKIKFNELEG